MNKKELVAAVAAQTEMTRREAEAVVAAMLTVIQEALAAGDRVKITGFGTFEARQRSARRGCNPRTGALIDLPAARSPVFRPAKALKGQVARLQRQKSAPPRIIAVTSGKGGAGKTNFVINAAVVLARAGLRVYIIDADLGTANVDVLLGVNARHTIEHLVNGSLTSVLDVVVDGPQGINIIPGGSGIQSLADLPEAELSRVIGMFEPLDEHADVILIDTGSGISRNVVNFLLAADEVIVIVTPEPHSVTDAYAIIKVLSEKGLTKPVRMVFNMVESPEEAREVAGRMTMVIERFLENTQIEALGYIVKDDSVSRAIKNFQPLVLYSPTAAASRCVTAIAGKLDPRESAAGGPDLMDAALHRGLVARLRNLFRR